MVLVWVWIFALPMDLWDPKILESIGKTLGSFVKITETMRQGRYTSSACISVYMNIYEPLPESIELEYEGKICLHILDYEKIPFIFRRCHEYGHVYKIFPLIKPEQMQGKLIEETKG